MARNARSTLPLVFGFAVIALLAGCDHRQPVEPFIEAASNAASGPTVNAPSNTHLVPVPERRIDVFWQDNSQNENGFEVQRSATGASGTFVLIATLGANVDNYGDSGLSLETQYCYRVRAFKNGNKYSTFSNTPCATTLPLQPLAASAVDAALMRTAHVLVTWTDNSLNESGFRVERAGSAAGPWATLASPGQGVTGLEDATGIQEVEQAVCYRVIAFNQYGDATPSNADCTAIPAVPTNLSATLPGDGSVDLAWSDNSAVEDGFEVRRDYGVIATLPPNATRYHDAGVAPDNIYRYWVRATKDGGSFGSSNIVPVVVATTPPSAPANLDAAPSSSSSVAGRWLDQSNEAGFRVERSTDGGASWSSAVTTGADEAYFNDQGLTPDQRACYRVIAFNNMGESPASNSTCTTPPAAPTDFTVTAVDATTVDFAWTDNSAVEDGYQVWALDDNGVLSYVVASVGPNTTTIRYEDPNAYYYSYSLVALKDGGSSDWSSAYPPPPPAGSASLRLSPRSASGVPAPHPLIKRRVKP